LILPKKERKTIWLHSRDWLRILAQAIQNAVDEGGRIGGAVTASQLDCFIEGDTGGSVAGEKQLEGAEAENVAIDTRHSHQAPVFRCSAKALINALLVSQDSVVEDQAELLKACFVQPIAHEPLNRSAIDIRVVVTLEQQLQGNFASARAGSHGSIR
jgi:hypothetical protein